VSAPDGTTRVTIIGGGLSSLAAAMALTEPEQNGRYRVTVYQIGWRLGGQGASGRNQQRRCRIEEHGLHLWFGCYDNAFAMMRQCYEELDRKSGPIRTIDDAFKGQDESVLTECIDGNYLPWRIKFPLNPECVGDPPTVWSYFVGGLEWLAQFVDDELDSLTLTPAQIESLRTLGVWDLLLRARQRAPAARALCRFLATGGSFAGDCLRTWLHWLRRPDKAAPDGTSSRSPTGRCPWRLQDVFWATYIFACDLAPDPRMHDAVQNGSLASLLGELSRWVWELVGSRVPADADLRRFWIMFYLGTTCARGTLIDDLITRGFAAADNEDLRVFLYRHRSVLGPSGDAAARWAYESPLLQALYDAAFAYAAGDPKQPSLAAGTGLHVSLRLLFDYKGHFFYEMQAGMGDVVFAPLYEVLKRRNVEFKFFHRVEQLVLDESGTKLQQIEISRQVTPLSDYYEPLIDVQGLCCWPSEPLYEKLREGEALKRAVAECGANLEHYESHWIDCGGHLTLKAGCHFDWVILGVTHACLASIVEPRIRAAWKPMLEGIQNVRTQSLQLWLQPTIEELGWECSPRILAAYILPLSSIADFSHLIVREGPPVSGRIGNLTYDCGVLTEVPGETQAQADARVLKQSFLFCDQQIAPVFPLGVRANNPNGLDWSKLYCDEPANGAQRLREQYFRANIDPTERYVLSIPGTQSVRRKAQDSGFKGLVLTGTWIDTGLNISAVETATMSGLQAARAISGYPSTVPGETDL
jgi:uncharacterized protein with NAD-binding domain and iron-sulfur cluster